MDKPSVCPECDSWDTERVHHEFQSDSVIEIRVCDECPTEFKVTYSDPTKEVAHTFEVER